MGNTLADLATRDVHSFSTFLEAENFHKNFHVNTNTLQKCFRLTKEQARTIVKNCQHCVTYLPVPKWC